MYKICNAYKILCILALVTLVISDKLLSVVVIYRHGTRTDLKTEKPQNKKQKLYGIGQLTNKGKREHFKLGKWFRKRYDGFLPKIYSDKDIYVLTTDVERTHMSAASNLAGLYPPKEHQVWHKKIPWQPIPVHTIPKHHDYLLAMSQPCPRYDLLNHKNNDVMISKDEPEIVTRMKILTKVSKDPLKLLKTGPFFCELINHFRFFAGDNVTNVTTPWGKKFTVFSGHDYTLVNIFSTMEIWNKELPPFSATLLFEMWTNKRRNTYIRIIYRTSKNNLRSLTLPGCKAKCRFEKFAKLLKPKSLCYHEWQKECSRLKLTEERHSSKVNSSLNK